jgi:hypothetical protein
MSSVRLSRFTHRGSGGGKSGAAGTGVLGEYNEWGILHGAVTNTGASILRDLAVSLSGPVAVDPHNGRKNLGTLQPAHRVDFSFFVRARESGSQVPLHVNTVFTDEAARDHRYDQSVAMRVVRPSAGAGNTRTGSPSAKAARILYLAANPTDTERLRLDQEIREIDETIRLGRWRDNVDLKVRPAVRFKDISQALLDLAPRIVHFSGHGTSDGRLYTENEAGRSKLVSAESLAPVFELMADHVECVIVNACHSESLARAVANHIDYVIGMRDEIGDRGAIAFSVGFYQALGAERSIRDAFTLGCAHLENVLQGSAAERIPLLLTKQQ